MQMLTKFESKSNRVKGIAFHPKLTLLAASLHSGSIQLWNFQMGVLVDRFEEHDGPVRGISFHATQPLFCSGGDDYKIKVWNYKTRRCLFTLHGHLDYVRSVYFHHEHPWILSASDDQTIRIWNWQSRTCIAILTGHNHYIMCAQFHPKEDYVVSASMDQTVRIWDISGLRKKSTTAQPLSFEEQIVRANAGQADLFGNTDAVVKYVLEGHDRGVNWASFHPQLPLIVSCGDDRQIKLWRMSDTKAWEVDTCRGHFNNVSVALFHPRHELIISDSEDKTIRVWDMSKRTAVQTFRRENDRFWVLTAHPTLNLFAAGHDSGLIVFKLDRERPAFALYGNTLYYVRDKFVRQHDLNTGIDTSVVSLRRLGSQYVQPRTLSFNPAERALIATSTTDNGLYELVKLPAVGSTDVRDSAVEGKRGTGTSAIFVARNRLAVLDRNNQVIEIRDLDNVVTKTIKCPTLVVDLFYGGTACVILTSATTVALFDIQQEKVIAELTASTVKYIVWNSDNTLVALMSKHTIVIANNAFAQSATIHETIRIKSGAWDDTGVFVYTTLNHIKFALPQGDSGIVKTLDQPIYVTRVKGTTVHALNRNCRAISIDIDPTEYRFKLALLRRNYDEVLHIISTSNLVGQSIIAYLQKKGFPEIALHFVQDKTTRFDLSIECGNLDVAMEMAKAIDREDNWARLGQQALKQGNHKIVEIAYQRTKNFDRLSFLYLLTGNPDKLAKMAKIAEMRGDQMAKFHNALYMGSVEARIDVLREVGLYPLAYLTAKTNNLLDLAEDILATAGLNEEDVESLLPNIMRSSLSPPPIVTATFDHNWPSVGITESYFDRALAIAAEGGVSGQAMDYGDGYSGDRVLDDWSGKDVTKEAATVVSAEEVEEAWDLAADEEEEEDDDDESDDESDEDEDESGEEGVISKGVSEAQSWVRNSPLAADHIAAGSFDTAMKLLKNQVGAVNFAPLRPLFLSLYQSSKLYLPGAASLPDLEIPLRRNRDHAEPRSILPVTLLSLQTITSGELRSAYSAFQKAKFAEAAAIFRSILHSLLFVVTTTPAQAVELQELVVICREYLIGLSIELERRRIATDPETQRRQLELAAYFTHCQLQPAHLTLALRLAMTTFSKAKNLATAATFAQRLLDLNPAPPVVTSARAVLTAAAKNPRDAVEIDYDIHSEFDICPSSLTPIYAGQPSVVDTWTGARYHEQYTGTLCAVSQITEIGATASGLRSSI